MPRVCPRLAIAFSPLTSSKILQQNDQWVSEMAKNGIHEIQMYRTLFYFSVFILCFAPATSDRLTIATVSVVGLTLMSYSLHKLHILAKTVDEVIGTNFKIGCLGLERSLVTQLPQSYGTTSSATTVADTSRPGTTGVADNRV